MYLLNNITQIYEENTIVSNIFKIIFIILIFLIIKMVVNKILDINAKHFVINQKYEYKAKTILSVLKNFINIVLYFLMITFIFDVFNVDTTSILAVAGIGGMAIAFASKSIVQDVITGAFIVFENQFNIGDLVTIEGLTGTVKYVGMRITKLEDIDGREIIIPNSKISIVINNSVNRMRASVSLYITDDKPFEIIEKAINKASNTIYKQFNLLERPKILGIDELDMYGYKIQIATKVQNGTQWDVQRALRKEIIKEFNEEKISFSRIRVG
ncbi:mechanosensitive ion channel family protein [Helcococcus ovis]|uniref:Mechanosensitive ion channel family protein n=1 Tax=Helcococcus ovis TaxID=72026 RepID=A0A4R9C2R7_9FIRM|nr:mechanosensitive ion channel family protein [Helcococcus ovis]TFF66053.1 mechanosensitive ion channel family protein [Helcococcus ovis]TFF66955.1 mechanosensitive ion channel family protein [Helcococcus ovis]TFF68562.1 mechanosensitive ion channel family protein [Helcococcus ovis]WNZ01289.1 mechanosensitive ion channel family protein [Helcococcus ovis]